MRILLAAILCIFVASSLAFAQKSTKSEPEPLKTAVVQTGTVIGKVLQVIDGRLKVTDKEGNPVIFTIDAFTKVADKTARTVALQDLKEGSNVEIEYATSKAGEQKAKKVTVK